MPTSTTGALERLGYLLLNNVTTQLLKQTLLEFERGGLQREKVVNSPMQRYNGRTAIHLAASKGLYECLDLLLKSGGNPNIRSSPADLSQTALHLAAREGYPRCIQVLLDYGAQLDLKTNHKETAESLVAGKPTCEKIIVHAIAKFQIPPRTKNQLTMVDGLHNIIGVEESFEKFKMLYEQLPPDHQDLATRWTDQPHQTLLYRAAANGRIEIVQYMLGISRNQPLHNLHDSKTPLLVACRKKYHGVAEILLRHSPKLLFISEHNGPSPLHEACKRDDSAMVKLLLQVLYGYIHSPDYNKEHKISLDFLDEQGRTPLFYACSCGNLDIVKQLIGFQLENTASVSLDVNLATKLSQRTALHAAIQSGNLEIVSLLLTVKGIAVDSEGRPTQETHKKVIELHKLKIGEIPHAQRKESTQSAGVPSVSSWDELEDAVVMPVSDLPPITPELEARSPIGTDYPHPRAYTTAASPTSPTPQGNGIPKNRSQTEVGSSGAGKISLRIFENTKTGELNFREGKNFDFLMLTPLAEACANGHAEIVKLLLRHGAHDISGLACRIASFIKRHDLMQWILSYHTGLKASQQTKDDDSAELSMDSSSLELKWDHLKLPQCSGEWLSSAAEYHPSGKELSGGRSNLKHLTMGFGNISAVHMEANQLAEVPIELFQLRNVKKINLSSNKLVSLPFSGDASSYQTPGGGWACCDLVELNLSSNRLMHLPVCMWQLPGIKKFLCSKNKLATLLPEDQQVPRGSQLLAKELTNVDLSGNSLTDVSPFFFNLPNLQVVNLSSNALTSLPETLWKCDSLQELNLSDNQLKELPMCQPEKVYRAACSQDHSYTFPFMQHTELHEGQEWIHVARPDPSLEESISSIRPLQTGQASLGGQREQFDYSKLHMLNLSKNKFSTFPEALACFAPNLTNLDISSNHLADIDVHLLPSRLKKLTARNCDITKIGTTILSPQLSLMKQNCRHESSKGLACQHRKHTQLLYLTNLDLSHNNITYMQLVQQQPAEEITDFGETEKKYDKNVTSLDLLYPVLDNLNLMSNNMLGKFNPNIGHQTHLKSIKLSGNKFLERIPMEFAHLKNTRRLTELDMKDLPSLVDPPIEYRTVGLLNLLTYMRSRLKKSDFYRSIKLFFVGNGERGKTALLRRLMNAEEHVGRTEGIDIMTWTYPKKKEKRRGQVDFLAWDFAGQEAYHTTHQCFYSKRSMYLALFRLTDGEEGIEELETWLRSVQLRAPGCPVIIVGTHLDQMNDPNVVKELEAKAAARYSNTKKYPKIMDVVSISCLVQKKVFKPIRSKMEELRSLLYNVACHLSVGKDGMSLEHKPDMSETDPKALFQQPIPQTFLSLQERLREKVREMKTEKKAPIMEHSEFVSTFKSKDLIEDEDELREAVYFLNLQGTLLHFDDYNLRNVYFLDPQWLAKLMADVIHPAAMGTATHIVDGVAEIKGLFTQSDVHPEMKERYICLMEKFEVAMKINDHQMIIPALMPEQVSYPKPDDVLSDVSKTTLDFYHPPLRRFWLADYVPAGFWPRLICRVATDQQIDKVLRTIIGVPTIPPSASISSNMDGYMHSDSPITSPQSLPRSTTTDSLMQGRHWHVLNWTPWQTGIAFAYRGRTLLVIKQVGREACDRELPKAGHFLEYKYRIEVHIYMHEWQKLIGDLMVLGELESPPEDFEHLPGLATKLLVMVTSHVHGLAQEFFCGMLISPSRGEPQFITYLPCWKCYAKIEASNPEGELIGRFISNQGGLVHSYVLEENIVNAVAGTPIECCHHDKLEIQHMTPDLIFKDLSGDISHLDNETPLVIHEDEVLGKGGFGFVCKGEIQVGTCGVNPQVAVKVFLQDLMMENVEEMSTKDLLELSKKPKHLEYGYKEIRQEVSFLSNLDHQNLTKLCGVRTSPYLCLVLELAKQSLRGVLKEYKACSVVLEPLTLKETALQIAQGLEYLHEHQVVHMDMKSPNVLIWHFPSPQDSQADRVEQARNVLIKIADYGISQVSTDLTMRVPNNPVGTPGYMAPELFDKAGLVISSEKVDVFAYGMVLYELMSQETPFEDVQFMKRNHEVREGQRPVLLAKMTRTLIKLQEIMKMCWEQEADCRPTMAQVVEWIQLPEFDRLRSSIMLHGVKSISCACVCRILPEHEVDVVSEAPPSLTLQDCEGIEGQDGVKWDDGEHSYPFLPEGDEDKFISDLEEESSEEVAEDLKPVFDPYTQIWMCGRDQRKGLLEIFTYNDGHSRRYRYSGYCSSEEVKCVCPVRNTIWMGTHKGVIKIFHAPTLKTKLKTKLEPEESTSASILDIIYVEELRTVLVSSVTGGLWSFNDADVQGSKFVIKKADGSPCFHFVKVVLSGKSEVEVWGTMENNRLQILKKPGGWFLVSLVVRPKDPRLRQLSNIACASFKDSSGEEARHVWFSYHQKSVLVSFDASIKKQRSVVRCDDLLKNEIRQSFQITALACVGHKVLIGTNTGHVATMDSETTDILKCLHWHKDKVCTLLAMPRQVEPCICAEIPFPDQEDTSPREGTERAIEDSEFLLVTSVGNGKKSYSLNLGDDEASRPDSAGKKQDIVLLTWRM